MKNISNIYAGKVIAVAIKKGGTGKSALSMNIAPEINPDIFYDTDDTPAVSTFNQFRSEESRWNVIRLTTKMDGVVDRFISELLEAKESGKSVLIDCGGFDSALTRTAVAAADLIISPVNDDPSDILGLQEFSDVLREISEDMGEKKVAHVVLNKVHPSRTNFKDVDEYLSKFDNLVRMDTAVPMDKTVPSKFGEGMGVVEHLTTRHGRAGNAMRSLFLDMRTAIQNVQ
ncbi:ParA family protein [Yersinia enterocolitica]|uniref:ParA family protein n=1 Tax=Yersinia enterocolitica TaxID=630 RepID=UPI001C60982E|nr:ParA family protein [Yersinia enterocolitica]EKN4180871.1 ParA family protein [Yersinia enterocolitica]MBW5840148.1 ParA family protein [Yersinia enterocolitica]MBW5848756.1 ParA family protein [Yersinia enterocolitica]MBW5857516.1 ParA family protein [Yersinia enterocolitica]MBW5861840.1 ParA family protein [Yersinia enterocolitica]